MLMRMGRPLSRRVGDGRVGESSSAVLQYWQYMRSLFDIQALPLEDTSGTTALDVGARQINGTYANVAGLTLANSLPPFSAPVLGATSYVNHNAANIAPFFSFSTGTYHFWVKAPLSLWDDAASRRMALFQADTNNRIDMQKLANVDTLQLDYRCAGVSNSKTVADLTYTSGWIPIGIRWNKPGDAVDLFVNARKGNTITALGNLAGAVSNASIGGNPYFPGGALAWLGLGTGVLLDDQIGLLSSKIARHKLIVFHGDSLTTGLQLGAVPYPKQLMRLYNGEVPTLNCVGYNKGESGKKIIDMIATAPANVDSYFNDGTFVRKICVYWGGTNDITTGSDAATVENRLVTYWQARKAAGWRVIGSTIIPNGVHTVGQQAVRAEVNTWIKANYANYVDALADPTANAAFDEEADVNNPVNYNADKTHLTTAGYGIIAGIVKAAVDTL